MLIPEANKGNLEASATRSIEVVPVARVEHALRELFG